MPKVDLEIIDFESVLQSRELQDSMIQRLTSDLQESRSNRLTTLKEYNAKHKEYMSKRESIIKNLSHMYNQSKDLGSQLEDFSLSQKVVNKKLQNAIKIEEKIIEEVEIEKQKKERLALEMVDLLQEQEEKRITKQKDWGAIKKATLVFKEKMNLHINLKAMDDHDCVTVTFFIDRNPDKDNYYVQLLNYNNIKWRIVEIQPQLKDKHMANLNVNFNKDYDVREIMALLCEIRKLFSKHY